MIKQLRKTWNVSKVLPSLKLKKKDNKIRYEVDNNILEKIDAAISSIENRHIKISQEKLKEGNSLILKQEKLIRVVDMEENRWDVEKCYLSDALLSDLEGKKRLNNAVRHREAAYKNC